MGWVLPPAGCEGVQGFRAVLVKFRVVCTPYPKLKLSRLSLTLREPSSACKKKGQTLPVPWDSAPLHHAPCSDPKQKALKP